MIARSPRLIAGAAILTLLIPVVRAQGPGGPGGRGGPGGPGGPGARGGGPNLLSVTAVQKELALTEKQKTQLKKLDTTLAQKRRLAFSRSRGERPDPEKMRAAMEKMRREERDALAKVLEPKQATRLSEIELQRDGIMAIARDDVAKKLKLTSAQTSQVKEIVDEMQQAERKLMPGPQGQGRFGRPGGRRNGPPGDGDGGPPGGAPDGEFAGGPPGEGGFPGGGPPPGGDDGGFPGGGPPGGGEGGFPGGGPPQDGGEGGFPGGGRPPRGEGAFPGGDGPGAGGPTEAEREEMRARFQKMREEREQIRTTAEKQVESVLSAEQKAAFKKLQGKPFDLALLRQGFGPGGQPRAGARQGNRNNRPQAGARTRRGGNQGQNPDDEPQF